MSMKVGTLYVVATPLGNLTDITGRARDLLCAVPLVAAEDTRRTRVLLTAVGASPRVVSLHAHSQPARLETLLKRLQEGTDVAVVSDAGTPTVSDPGAHLVREARARGVPVIPIPGPSAVVTALSVSGFPADRFTFLGFLPRKGKQRQQMMQTIAESPWPVVLFEAPLRLVNLLDDLEAVCGGERLAVVARELTKRFEEVRAGNLHLLAGYYRESPPRGEITLVLEGVDARARDVERADLDVIRAQAHQWLTEGVTRRATAARLAVEFRLSRNEAYRLVMSL
jgi:16S rRNA (cytidine1402-2'-O)-methyltransferase